MKYLAFLLLLSFFPCACPGSKNVQSAFGEIQEKQDYTTDPTIPSNVKKSTVRTASPTNCPLIHVVQKGESLWIIAQKYGVTTNDITDASNIENASLIKIRQELVIPVSNNNNSNL